jgi:hypothetical protein
MTSPVSTEPATAELHHQVQQFYVRQMQLLDDGAVAAWAATFTEDGSFAANARPEPVVGRDAIEAGARAAAAQLAEDGIVRRHWLGMLTVEPLATGDLRTRCYALVISTPKGGQAGVHVSTVCEDVLVRDGVSFAVRERRVTRDDLS